MLRNLLKQNYFTLTNMTLQLHNTTLCDNKFIGDLRQVGGFLRILRFPPPIKLNHHDIAEILLKVVLSTIALPTKKTINHSFTIQHSLHQHWNLQNWIFTINMEEVPLLLHLPLRRYRYRNWSSISTLFPGISSLHAFCKSPNYQPVLHTIIIHV